MKGAKIKQIVIVCVMLLSTVVVGVAFTVAWYQQSAVTPYFFEIDADGILYIYVDSITIDNEDNLVPAVAMPGAVEEGLNIDVLELYEESSENPSYVQKTATITSVVGGFTIYNEGYAYQPVELPKDEEGYTLAPVINSEGEIQWKDDNDHTLGWQEQRFPIFNSEGDVVGYSQETDYKPLLDENDKIVWKGSYSGSTWAWYGQQYWECEQEPVEGSSTGLVNFSLRFKETAGVDKDGNVVNYDDYYADGIFGVKRIYFSNSAIPLGQNETPGVGNSAKAFDTLEEDNMSGTFTIYGSEELYVHAEVYLLEPDELLDPHIRGSEVYMSIGISVEVKQLS